MMKEYYFITVFRDVDDRWGIKGARCWGFYTDLDKAKYIVENNITDLWETIYNYAVIETYNEGISGYADERIFYQYDIEKEKYIQIPELKEVKPFVSFSIG